MGADRLVCEETTKRYGQRFTLGPLSMEIQNGVTCLIGANGAGKSTFFRLAAGVERPTSGSISLHSADGRAGLGYLPQDPQFPGAATCEEFLLYVAWLQRIPRSERAKAVASALEQVGLENRRSARIRALSGGMRRRLGVAHALVHQPALLLLDEPTVGLDPAQRVAVRETIDAISSERIVVVSTHLVEDIRGLADRAIVLREGSVVYDGDVPTLAQQAKAGAPGDTDLERGIATLMGEST